MQKPGCGRTALQGRMDQQQTSSAAQLGKHACYTGYAKFKPLLPQLIAQMAALRAGDQ